MTDSSIARPYVRLAPDDRGFTVVGRLATSGTLRLPRGAAANRPGAIYVVGHPLPVTFQNGAPLRTPPNGGPALLPNAALPLDMATLTIGSTATAIGIHEEIEAVVFDCEAVASDTAASLPPFGVTERRLPDDAFLAEVVGAAVARQTARVAGPGTTDGFSSR